MNLCDILDTYQVSIIFIQQITCTSVIISTIDVLSTVCIILSIKYKLSDVQFTITK